MTDWHQDFQEHKRFMETPLGKLYRAHEHALIDYWRHDDDERISSAKLKALDERCREATKAFVTELKRLALATEEKP